MHLPVRVVGTIGLVMIVGHNLLDGISPQQFGAWAPLWNVLHVQGPIALGYLLYPLIPWVGVMALGFALGHDFRSRADAAPTDAAHPRLRRPLRLSCCCDC